MGKDADPKEQPTRGRPISRRTFVRRLGVLGIGGLAGWRLFVSTRGIVVEKHEIGLAGLTAPLRFVFLSDTHLRRGGILHPFTTRATVARACELAGSLEPDVLIFGGDLSAETFGGGLDLAREAIDLVAGIPSTYGAFACLGNHDQKPGFLDGIIEHYERSPVRLLDEEWLELETRAGTLTLGGVRWRREGYADCRTLGAAPEGRPRILLAHDPSVVLDLEDPCPFDLVLSGHTHGGQVYLPLIGAPWTPSPAAPKYLRGLRALSQYSYVYVNRGIGTVFVPVRLGSRPEVTAIDLVPLSSTTKGNETP